MITTLDMTAPIVDQSPGTTSVVLELESNNEPVSFEDSFQLWVNGVEVSSFNAVKTLTWEITWSGEFIADQEVLIEFQAVDNDETVKSRWSFNVDGVSTFSSDQYKWAAILSRITNYLPEHTEARSKEASVFKQFVNPIALKIDESRLRINRQNSDLSVNKSNIEDPDWIYTYRLNSNEQFKYSIYPDGTKEYEAPEIYGYVDHNRIPIPAIQLEDFWRKLPTRLELTELTDKHVAVTPSMSIDELGHLSPSRFIEPQELVLWAHSADSIVKIEEGLQALRLKISGTQQHGMEKVETVTILKDGITEVPGVWQEVNSIEVLDAPGDASAQLKLMRLPPRGITKEDGLFKVNEEIVSWELVEETSGSYLSRKISGFGYIADLARGEDNRYIENKYVLFDTSDAPVYLQDFCIDHSKEYLYGINQSKLYVWDRRAPVQTGMNRLNGAERDPEVNFHVVRHGKLAEYSSGDYLTDYTIEVDRAKGERLVKRWAWAVVTESGSRSYIDSDGVSGHSDYQWQDNSTPIASFGISTRPFTVELNSLGGEIFELYLEFTDGTTEVSKQMVPKMSMQPLAEYDISHLLSTLKNVRIHVRQDGTILIAAGKTLYEVTKKYDYYTPDYEAGLLILREDYDAIEVILDD